jgi:hypothetical protein
VGGYLLAYFKVHIKFPVFLIRERTSHRLLISKVFLFLCLEFEALNGTFFVPFEASAMSFCSNGTFFVARWNVRLWVMSHWVRVQLTNKKKSISLPSQLSFLLLILSVSLYWKDNDGQTPLHYAVVCEREAIAEYLVKENAATNIKDNDGNSLSDLCEANWPWMQVAGKQID